MSLKLAHAMACDNFILPIINQCNQVTTHILAIFNSNYNE
jgi:hypothetical protein